MTTTAAETMNIVAAENQALDIAMAADDKVLLLGEDIADPIGGVYKVTKGLSTKYGRARVRATPISEQTIVGAAVGAALAGYRPVAEIMFFDFSSLAMDQIVNHAAKFRYMTGGRMSSPITIRTAVGSNRFGSQHSQSLEAWFMHIPGLRVVMPSNPADAKGLLLSCVFSEDPCLFIENTTILFSERAPVPIGDVRVPLGRAAVPRPGSDVTLIAYGSQVPPALTAAERLSGDGVDVEVIDLRSLLPLDLPTIMESVEKTRRAAIVHIATTFCGPSAEVACQITEQLFGDLLAPVLRLGSDFTPRGFAQTLSSEPTADSIYTQIGELVRNS